MAHSSRKRRDSSGGAGEAAARMRRRRRKRSSGVGGITCGNQDDVGLEDLRVSAGCRLHLTAAAAADRSGQKDRQGPAGDDIIEAAEGSPDPSA